MKFLRSSLRARFGLAALAGLALAAAFPKVNLAGLAWTVPALWLVATHGLTGREQFRVGYVGGLVFYLASLHWLLFIPVRGFPIIGWLALSGYMALYPAAWVWLAWKCFPRASSSDYSAPTPAGIADRIAATNWSQRLVWCLTGAALWVALEMIASRLFTGFPWLLLGISQVSLIPLIQIASVTGVAGISFLAVWMSLALLCAGLMLLRQPTVRWIWLGEIILPLMLIGGISAWGWQKIRHANPAPETITAALIQPSIPQTMIWDEKQNAARFKHLMELSEQALTNRIDLLIWPEAAVPNLLRYNEETYRAITGLARSHQVWMILGADDVEPRGDTPDPDDADWFNSSFLIDPGGNIIANYRKQRLVIFGEYIPLTRVLPFLKFFTPIEGGFTSGDRPVTFDARGLKVKTSVLICFEDVFARHARHYVTENLDFLLNLTNDGWFGESAQQWQHAANATFRAVENGVPLVRCTNNGLTCWIDEHGRKRAQFTDARGSVYGEGFLIVELPRLAGQERARTFYNRRGDWFGWGCVVLGIIAAGKSVAVDRKRRRAA